MISIIDIGNTNLKFALFEGGRFLHSWRISVSSIGTAAGIYAVLKVLCTSKNIDIHCLKGAAISSVVPSTYGTIKELFESFLGIMPVFITGAHADLFGIRVLVEEKIVAAETVQIGPDRVADVVAARTLWPDRDLLVVDMGTVTVFNLLDKSGTLLGQVFAPGLSCLTKSMSACAALLPQVCVNVPSKVICNSSISSMESGLYWGYISMVEGIINRISAEALGMSLYVVATGGGSNLVGNNAPIHETDSLLTIKGILQIYERLKEN
ncbi:MAG: type III pantothenate kinase [Aaplasma endosymbiont of Hyalomma asiaticum]